MTDDQSVKLAALELEKKAGRLDVVVNNAGVVGAQGPLLDVGPASPPSPDRS